MTTIMKLSGVSTHFYPSMYHCMDHGTGSCDHMVSSFSAHISIFKRITMGKNFDVFLWCSLHLLFLFVEVLMSDRECLEILRFLWLKWMFFTLEFSR